MPLSARPYAPRGDGRSDAPASSFCSSLRSAWGRNIGRSCVLLISALGFLLCAIPAPAAEEADSPAVRLFDTGTPSAKPLSEEAVAKRDGWKLVPEDDLAHKFTGDAVLQNDKLTVVLRQAGWMAEAYSSTEKGAKLRASVSHVGARTSWTDLGVPVKTLENSSAAVMLEAAFKLPVAPSMRFRLTAGERILEVRPGGGATAVAVQSKARHVVVPDFNGDDMVFGGSAFSGIDLPADNFLLSLLAGGDGILMCGWQSNRQNAALTTAGAGEGDLSCVTTVTCEGDKRIWLAFLEGPALWHSQAAGTRDNWKPLFSAKWRCSRVREAGFADSWDLEKGPTAEQLASKGTGPVLIYPFDRTRETPLTAFCPVDLLRNTMGVGPCQYILELEGLASEENPTPDLVMTWVEKQFQKKSSAKAADEIAERFRRMIEQVRHAQARVEQYAAFARIVRGLCTDKDAPKGAQALLPTVGRIDETLKAFAQAGATPERAGQLATEIVGLAGKGGALADCQRLGAQVRAIGTAQSAALSRCRMAARWLRAQARILAREPGGAELAKQVQTRAEEILWKP